MKNTSEKQNLLAEATTRKIAAQKAGAKPAEGFNKFKYSNGRNFNNSNVGPSWGPRKGN